MPAFGRVFVSRYTISGTWALTAQLTSRSTCSDSLASSLKTTTMRRLASIASRIVVAQSSPALMSRGAYQQQTPSRSRLEQTASAVF